MTPHKAGLLFTKDEWSIYKTEYLYAVSVNHVLAYAHHQGCAKVDDNDSGIDSKPLNCWHTGDTKPRCVLCNTDVPDEIQALIVLYQWER